MNPLSGLMSLLDSSKGNVFLLSVGALLYAREGIPATFIAIGIVALGITYMVTRAWSDNVVVKTTKAEPK